MLEVMEELSSIKERLGVLEATEKERQHNLWPTIRNVPKQIEHLEDKMEKANHALDQKFEASKPSARFWLSLVGIIITIAAIAGGVATRVFQSSTEGTTQAQKITNLEGRIDTIQDRAAEDRKTIKENTKAIRVVSDNVIKIGEALKIKSQMQPTPKVTTEEVP